MLEGIFNWEVTSFFVFRDYEPRLVTIEKKDTLGISIAAAFQGGVFVSSVNEGSVAAKAGLKCGDQLLEVHVIPELLVAYKNWHKD